MKTLAYACLLALASCVGDDEEVPPGDPSFVRDPSLDVANVSAHDASRSHNMGLNCMGCHQAHGPGRGRFTVAVTVFDPEDRLYPNPVLELYTAPPSTGAQPAYVFPGDALGNVFSTEALPLPDQPLFVRVRSRDNTLSNQMPFPTSSGACNICHRQGFRVRLEPSS